MSLMHGPEAFGFLNSEKLCAFAALREITLNWDEWNWQQGQWLSQGPGYEECLAQRRKDAKEEGMFWGMFGGVECP